jgi:hypothetical protein
MLKFWRFCAVLLSFGAFLFLTNHPAHTQSPLFEYFPQTGHTVEGEFLNFYRAISNPEFVYGFPITESFFNEAGVQLQYFQRTRFEKAPGQPVALTPVGSELYRPGNPIASLDRSTGGCRTFENRFQVCTSFLDFFRRHGGLDQFGEPISAVEKIGERKVQYFENARMEWYPDSAELGLEIRLAHLGRLLFERQQEDPKLLWPLTDSAILEITTLHAHVFTEFATARQGGDQRLFIILQDQNFAPIPNAPYEVTVKFPSGERATASGLTNGSGFAEAVLALDGVQAQTGLVEVHLATSAQGFESQSRTSFRLVP